MIDALVNKVETIEDQITMIIFIFDRDFAIAIAVAVAVGNLDVAAATLNVAALMMMTSWLRCVDDWRDLKNSNTFQPHKLPPPPNTNSNSKHKKKEIFVKRKIAAQRVEQPIVRHFLVFEVELKFTWQRSRQRSCRQT